MTKSHPPVVWLAYEPYIPVSRVREMLAEVESWGAGARFLETKNISDEIAKHLKKLIADIDGE